MNHSVISSTQKIWKIKSNATVTSNNIVEVLSKNRGVSSDFFQISIKKAMPDPYVFVDMQKAVERIVKAIEEKQSIAILGDYDVDGVSSTAVFIKFFKQIGAEYDYAIPDRMQDGYGLNRKTIDRFNKSLIITVDNGSTAIDELKYARDLGVEIIVIDHHEMSQIPADTVIVNPFRPDDHCEFTYLCATGLAFMCVIGINRLLRERGFYKNRKEPDLLSYIDLVTLATICDVVPLVGLNRAFVKTGLKVLSHRKNLGIDAMMKLAAKNDVDSESVGFFFGPRLNASGRLASADISLQLLTTEKMDDALMLAKQLDTLNEERKRLDQEIVEEAEEQIDHNQRFICVFGDNWHVGVIGIVAGRLKEKYNKPTIVISGREDGICHASCRSTEDVDISKIIGDGIDLGIITSGGGHACAGGFVISKDKVIELKTFLEKYDFPEIQPKSFDVECYIDAVNVTNQLIDEINTFEPFGESNPRPNFIIRGLLVEEIRIIKDSHISISFCGQQEIRGIAFKAMGTDLEKFLRVNIGREIDLLGQVSIVSWRGHNYINLMILDAK